ncbi:ectoine/hydroxyectoine ABC transporter substrate-binding protein EhuB [Megalodesulfovibrio gigas]|uniref:ectoine/hydroxyectoine ABC transporter substrate-binding protein EhuB n=1 Tax=Megalodesulfovibrio gigas TaxID=879 RepID=UPI00130DB9B4|nr:ectoine/hydroxyectoine ABC transporter substrate-binding protein EhuB [Megalodesulfovibrio gigas]
MDTFRRAAQPSIFPWRSLTGWAGLMLCAVAAVGAAVWLLSGRPWDRSLARLVDAGVIRIGYANEAPYAFLRPDGEVSGHGPELARRIVEHLGIERVEWRVTDFSALIAELEDGHIDVIAAGMFITQERARRVQFSEPIFRVEQALLVAKGNPKGLHSYADALTRPDVKLAVLSGAVEAELLQRLGVPDAQRVLLPDVATGRAAVETGLADGLALTSPTIEWMVRHDYTGKTARAAPFRQTILGQESGHGYGAFAFRKEDRALLEAWNAAQGELLYGRDFQMLIEEFGFTRNELPGPVRTREILSR